MFDRLKQFWMKLYWTDSLHTMVVVTKDKKYPKQLAKALNPLEEMELSVKPFLSETFVKSYEHFFNWRTSKIKQLENLCLCQKCLLSSIYTFLLVIKICISLRAVSLV